MAALGDPWWRWLWTPVPAPSGVGTVLRPQPLYWLFIAYAYFQMVAGVVVLVMGRSGMASLYARRSLLMAAAGAIPVVTSVLGEMGLLPKADVDLTPVAFPVSLALANWGFFRFRVLDLASVSADLLIEQIGEGLVVVDRQDRIVMMNRSGAVALGTQRDVAIGCAGTEVSGEWARFRALFRTAEPGQGEVVVGNGPGERAYDVRVTPLMDEDGGGRGQLMLIRDVTERRRAERERERLLGDLMRAQGEIKTLTGLLPICASCKQIRDERGAWHSLEAYLGAHSGARFTHGLCPDCMRRYEGGLLAR